MFALSKPKSPLMKGNLVLGAILISSLALAGCSSAGPSEGSSGSASDSALSAPAPPLAPINFTSDVFDTSKQSLTEFEDDPQTVHLSSGVVTRKLTDGSSVISYLPYENKDTAWTYDTKLSVDDLSWLRWQDKSYIVASGIITRTEAVEGLTAEKKLHKSGIVVLDVETGEAVKTIDGEEYESGNSSGNEYTLEVPSDTDTIEIPSMSSNSRTIVSVPYMTGLVLGAGKLNGTPKNYKLVNPLTGDTIATDQGHYPKLNSEAGFYSIDSIYPRTDKSDVNLEIQSVFGKYAIVAEKPANEVTSSSTYSLFDTTSRTVISSKKCNNPGQYSDSKSTNFSADFRYVNFASSIIFDTESGNIFCSLPEDTTKRTFNTVAVDNDGYMYGLLGSEWNKVSISDNSKIIPVSSGEQSDKIIGLTNKGSALIDTGRQDMKSIVALPLKG